jgi:hypothetical protein
MTTFVLHKKATRLFPALPRSPEEGTPGKGFPFSYKHLMEDPSRQLGKKVL